MFFPPTVHPRTVSEDLRSVFLQDAPIRHFSDILGLSLAVRACQDSLEQEVLMIDDFPKATLPSRFFKNIFYI